MSREMKLDQLLEQFRSSTLCKKEWTHLAHLRVATQYLQESPPEMALKSLRQDIQRLNLAHGVLTTPSGGYHETRTRVWLSVLLTALSKTECRNLPFEDLPAAGVLATSDVVSDFYRQETLESWIARTAWVPPDFGRLTPDPSFWGETPALFSIQGDMNLAEEYK